MRFTDISLILALSTVAVAAPHPEGEKTLYKAGSSPRYILARGPGEKTLHKGSASHLVARQSSGNTGSAGNSDYCYGQGVTCASCFGSNWTECPDGITCYDKTDPTSTCSSSGTSGTSGSSGSGGSGSGGSAGGSDYCYGADATCASCFGAGYLECSDGYTCYNPADPTTSCPDGTSGTGSGSGTSTGGAGSGLIGSSTTSTAAGSDATTGGGAGSAASTHASSSTTSHSSTVSTASTASTTSTTSTTGTATTTAATTAPPPVSGNKLGGAVGLSIPVALPAGAGAAVLIAAALL